MVGRTQTTRIDYFNVVFAGIGAAAAVAIPTVLYFDARSDRDHETAIARDSRTLDVMNELDAKASTIVAEKNKLDVQNKVTGAAQFSAAYIDPNHFDVQTQVYRLLNLYEYVCLGAKENLFSLHIIEQIRGDALRQTWSDYGAYIREQRKRSPALADAWRDCDSIAETTVP